MSLFFVRQTDQSPTLPKWRTSTTLKQTSLFLHVQKVLSRLTRDFYPRKITYIQCEIILTKIVRITKE